MHFLLFFFFCAFEEQVAAAPLSSISPSAPPPPWQTQTAAEKLDETARKLQQRLPASSAASPAAPVSSAAAAPTSSAAAPTSSAAAPTTGSSSAAEPQVAPADAAAEDCDEPDVPLRPGEVRCKRQPIVGTAIAPEPAEGFAFFGGLSFVAYVLIFLILLCSCCYVRKKGCGCCVWLCCGGCCKALFSCGSGSGGDLKGDKGKAKDRKKKREDQKGRRGEKGGRGEDTSDDNDYVLHSDFEVAGEKDERARSGETSVVGSPVRGAGRRADAKRGRDRGTQKNKKQRKEEQGKSADRKKAKSKQENRRRNEARRKVVDEEDSSSRNSNSEQPQPSVTSSADPLPTLLGSEESEDRFSRKRKQENATPKLLKRGKVMLEQTETSKDVRQKRSKTKDEVKSRRRSASVVRRGTKKSRPPSRSFSECSSAAVSPQHSGRCSDSPSSADSDDSATTSPTRHQKLPAEVSSRSRQVIESVKIVKEREPAGDNKSRRSMKVPEKRRFAPTERSSDPARRSGSRVGLKKGGARRPALPPTSDAEDGASLEQEMLPEAVPDSRSTGKRAPKNYLALEEKRSIPARVLSPDPAPGRGRTGSGATTRAKAGKNNSTASGQKGREKPKTVRKKPKPEPEAGPEAGGESDVRSVQVTANIASSRSSSRTERRGKGNEVQLPTGPRAKTKPKPASKKTGTNKKKNSGNRSTSRVGLGATRQETSRPSRKK